MEVRWLALLFVPLAAALVVEVNISEDARPNVVGTSLEGGHVQSYVMDLENLGSVTCRAALFVEVGGLKARGATKELKPSEAARLMAFTRLANGSHNVGMALEFCGKESRRGPFSVNATRVPYGSGIVIADHLVREGEVLLLVRSKAASKVVIVPALSEAGRVSSGMVMLTRGRGKAAIRFEGGGSVTLEAISADGKYGTIREIELRKSGIAKRLLFWLREKTGV